MDLQLIADATGDTEIAPELTLEDVAKKVDAVLQSQLRTEQLVSELITSVKPSVEALQKGGIMGLLGALR